MKKYVLLLLLPQLLWAADLEQLSAMKGSQYQLFHSEKVDHDYHIYVHVPRETEENKNKKFPTVYLLDGGNTFPMFVPYAKYLSWTEDMSEVVMVGISYGTDDWRQGNMRSRDFTLPAKDRDHYGGAEKFHQFLSTELIPLIEKKYPADPEQRILFGHSLGGQFALYSAMFQPQTFSGLIASNPAIHRNTELFLATVEPNQHQPKLFIMQADQDNEEYRLPRQKWLAYWQDKPHHWQQQVMTIKGHNHMSSVVAAFRQGMKWLTTK